MKTFVALATFQAVSGFSPSASLVNRNVPATSVVHKSRVSMAATNLVTNEAALAKAADEARGLAMDSIAAAASGHLGLPLGCGEIGAVLFGQELSYNPEDSKWINRDRFILSGGHGSMFLYSWLHMAGYDLSLEEVKNFRQLDSKTPGHPEYGWTDGVEATTGPLGTGVSNMVGAAAAAKLFGATFNTEEHTIIDHHVVALCGDGCLQEGVAMEAAAFAGHEGLDNAILIYDSNDVTLDKMLAHTQSEDVAAKYTAMGWDVVTVDGHDLEGFAEAFKFAKDNNNGKPKMLICKTIIGKGIDEVAGTCAGHGEAGVAYVDDARSKLGLPEEKWHVSDDTKSFFAGHKEELKAKYDAWQETYAAWKEANPEKAQLLQDAIDMKVPDDLLDKIPEFEVGAQIPTRQAGADAMQTLAAEVPMYTSGSADLHGSTKNYLKGVGDFSRSNNAGRNFYYGIREHAMGGMMNGMGYYGGMRTSGATFLVFSDYMRGPIRVAALSHLPVTYYFTHDSIGVGEDGPTHQPVETVSSLRLIPNLDVIRAGDAEEAAAAMYMSVARNDGPTATIMSRQNLPVLDCATAAEKRQGTLKGGYTILKETEELTHIIMSSGSELHMAVAAAKELGGGVRVVSMPSMEVFDRQSDEYKESVLPASCDKKIAIEAGVTPLWYKYGAKQVIGTDTFGLSAPAELVYERKGITTEKLVEACKAM